MTFDVICNNIKCNKSTSIQTLGDCRVFAFEFADLDFCICPTHSKDTGCWVIMCKECAKKNHEQI